MEALRPKEVIPIKAESQGEGFLKSRTAFLKNRVDMSPLEPLLSKIPKIAIRQLTLSSQLKMNVKVWTKLAKFFNPKTRLYRIKRGVAFESSSSQKGSQRSLRDISKRIKGIRQDLTPGRGLHASDCKNSMGI